MGDCPMIGQTMINVRVSGAARWWLDPAKGVPHVRVPCTAPGCGWAEKYAERTRILLDAEHAEVHAF
ncbi:hypothetical protein [Streptomyces sp. NPDC055681]